MHALLLSAWVDGHDARVDDHDYAHDQIVLLKHGVGHERDQVEGLILRAVELHHNHEEVGPGEDSAAEKQLQDQQATARASTHLSQILRWQRTTLISMSMGW